MPISYVRPDSVSHAAALCAAGGRILAGGQSLIAQLNRGEIDDVTLIDINRLPELDRIGESDGWIEIGGLARLEAVRLHPLVIERLPMLAAALAWVANPAIRLRGTLLGNLVQFAPGAEAVAAAAAADAVLVTPDGESFRLGTLPPARLATHVRLRPSPLGTSGAFLEVQRRAGHLGTLGCGVARQPDGSFQATFSGLLEVPLLADHVARALRLGLRDLASLSAALLRDLAGRSPRSDLHADANYRMAVAPVLVQRVLPRLGAA